MVWSCGHFAEQKLRDVISKNHDDDIKWNKIINQTLPVAQPGGGSGAVAPPEIFM